ncbi:hypothetical protein TNCV_3844771 [Trichonephila clavipes]|nr:hypothetical protein TNCV_3844771 [Trichonephila clavipes]
MGETACVQIGQNDKPWRRPAQRKDCTIGSKADSRRPLLRSIAIQNDIHLSDSIAFVLVILSYKGGDPKYLDGLPVNRDRLKAHL